MHQLRHRARRPRFRKLWIARAGALPWIFLVVSLCSAGQALAEGDGDGAAIDSQRGLEIVGDVGVKAGAFCNAGGYHCSGKWPDLIDHLFTSANGSVLIYVTPAFEQELSTKGFCALHLEKFIYVRDPGEETVVLEQLYVSYALDRRFTLRLIADSNGACKISYIRALYNT